MLWTVWVKVQTSPHLHPYFYTHTQWVNAFRELILPHNVYPAVPARTCLLDQHGAQTPTHHTHLFATVLRSTHTQLEPALSALRTELVGIKLSTSLAAHRRKKNRQSWSLCTKVWLTSTCDLGSKMQIGKKTPLTRKQCLLKMFLWNL